MDSLLVLLSASLVGYKVFKSREKKRTEEVSLEDYIEYDPVGTKHPLDPLEPVEPQPSPPPSETQPPPAERNTTSDTNIPAFLLNTRPSTMSHPQIAEVAPRRLPAAADDGTGVNEFHEQFFPQDTKSTGQSVVRSPWMRAIESSQNAPPKKEREAEHPSQEHDKDDIRGTNIPALLREREEHHAAQSVSKMKKFQSPVIKEKTANGEKRGFHPIKRYHKFVLSDQPVVELPEAPRGSFASGAGKSSLGSNLDNNRRELHVQHTGVPTASFKVGIPDASFELEGSNAEHWEINAHVASASRAPVDAGSNTALIKQSFTLAHDESLDILAVKDKSNLSSANLPRSAVDAGSNTDLIKQSLTLAHDERLDLLAVTNKSALSKTHIPSNSGEQSSKSGLMKESFRLAHDGGLDLLAVTDKSGLSKTHIPSATGEMSSKSALMKESLTLAHDGGLDLVAVTENAGLSKTHIPSTTGKMSSKSALMKESFTLAYDGGLDLVAVTENCSVTKTHLPPGEGPAASDMQTKERGVRTPSVVGAKGGTRQKHVDKSSEFKSVTHKENLAASAQSINMTSGVKASKPSAASKTAEHEHTEGTLAEEESGSRVRGAPHTRKATDTSSFERKTAEANQFSLGNAKDAINSTPFTSKNFVAPQDRKLPSFLRIAPTASQSLSQKQVSLKESDRGLADMLSLGRNKGVSRVKTSNLSERAPEKKETKLRSVVLNRTNRGVVVANPYNRPRPMIQ